MRIPVNDENVTFTIKNAPNGEYPKVLADDEWQNPDGSLWAHIQDMASRGLVIIENNIARMKK